MSIDTPRVYLLVIIPDSILSITTESALSVDLPLQNADCKLCALFAPLASISQAIRRSKAFRRYGVKDIGLYDLGSS